MLCTQSLLNKVKKDHFWAPFLKVSGSPGNSAFWEVLMLLWSICELLSIELTKRPIWQEMDIDLANLDTYLASVANSQQFWAFLAGEKGAEISAPVQLGLYHMQEAFFVCMMLLPCAFLAFIFELCELSKKNNNEIAMKFWINVIEFLEWDIW